MGHWVRCKKCNSEIYTTGSRLPRHETPEGKSCDQSQTARAPVEYATGLDSDPGVYNGGLPEMGKNS